MAARSVSVMLTLYCASFLFWCLQVAAADAIPPQNVKLITLNTWYTLNWDWDQRAAENHNVSFTTQYVLKHKLKKPKCEWMTLCENTSQTYCHLPASAFKYPNDYKLRVRANVDLDNSAWVLTDFCPERDADLGPPTKVDIILAGSDLEVRITDPLTNNNISMKKYVEDMYYRIMYWEASPNHQALDLKLLDGGASLVILPHLKPRTLYCMSVQSRYDYYNKTSNFTAPQCMQTEAGPPPLWQIFLYFFISMAVCFSLVGLILLGFYKCSQNLKHIFYPPIELPSHFQERNWTT